MKNNSLIKEITVATALIIVLFILLNPFAWWMPDMMLAGLLAIALVVFGLFAIFIIKEKVIDEREEQHKVIAGRAAFIAGTAILTIAIVWQSLSHHVDPWLYLTFVVMVIAKLGTRAYTDRNF
ncbi:MAG: hypothetical protein ABIO57_00355 [Candidatus Paceibacterota bacterium]